MDRTTITEKQADIIGKAVGGFVSEEKDGDTLIRTSDFLDRDQAFTAVSAVSDALGYFHTTRSENGTWFVNKRGKETQGYITRSKNLRIRVRVGV